MAKALNMHDSDKNAYKILVDMNERDIFEVLYADRRIILKWILKYLIVGCCRRRNEINKRRADQIFVG